MPEGSGEAVVMDNGVAAGLIVIENDLEAVAPTLSVTCALKLNVPAVEGVPLKTPAVDKLNPSAVAGDHV